MAVAVLSGLLCSADDHGRAGPGTATDRRCGGGHGRTRPRHGGQDADVRRRAATTSRSIRSSPTTSSAPSSSCISSGTTNGRTTWRMDAAGSSRYAKRNPPYSTANGRSGASRRWMVTSPSTSETTAMRLASSRAVAGRRVEYLRHPLTLMRAALAPNATLSNVRTQGTERLVDLKLDAIHADRRLRREHEAAVARRSIGGQRHARRPAE